MFLKKKCYLLGRAFFLFFVIILTRKKGRTEWRGMVAVML